MGMHHTEIRNYRIFALVLGNDIFVGKTASPRMSAVYSRHRCGDVAATRGYLDQEECPSLHILERLECTGAEAYRHVLAYVRWFEEAGYCSINHMGTAVASEELYPATEAIFRALPRESAGAFLSRTHVPKPADANEKPAKPMAIFPKKEKSVQMNLRMTSKDKQAFDRFCKQYHLRAREAVRLLLDQAADADHYQKQLLSTQTALRMENEQFTKQLALGNVAPQEKKATAYLQFVKSGLREYLQYFHPQEHREPLPAFPYKRFRKDLKIRYEYPRSEGFFLLITEAILWGRHHARFVVGRGSGGEYLKLRFYPKPMLLPAAIWDYPSGTRWWVGCQMAADGAMELTAAFPLPKEQPPAQETNRDQIPKRKTSLDEQIQIAQTRK